MNKEEKAVLWSGRIQEFRSSGQSCRQWCMDHKISLSTMGYWIRKLGTEETVTDGENELVFAKLPSEQEIAGKTLSVPYSPVSIFISGGIRIEISDFCKPELLESLIRTLKNYA